MISITVKQIRGKCPVYKEGDQIILNLFYIESKQSADICMHAFASMSTLLSAFSHGTSAVELGIGKEKDVGYLQCPDPGFCKNGGTVIFEIRRLPSQTSRT